MTSTRSNPTAASSPFRDRPPIGQPAAVKHVGSTMAGFAIGPVFVVLAAWFVWGPDGVSIPESPTAIVASSELTTGPPRPRGTPRDPPSIVSGGYELACMECHRLFQSPGAAVSGARLVAQHTDIILNHGLNNRCSNCHDPKQRNYLVLLGGETIPFSESPRLCATCHGTTYRDWEIGIHGRTEGSWDALSGKQRRLACTECHNPHSPAFPPMTPLPGPDTLRMGQPHDHSSEPHHDTRNPLRRIRSTDT